MAIIPAKVHTDKKNEQKQAKKVGTEEESLYLCTMKVVIYKDVDTLPTLPQGAYFHSRELMELCQRTPHHKPYMAVVTDDNEQVVACLLAVERYRYSWMLPLLHRQVRILGEGVYREDVGNITSDAVKYSKNMLFSMMIDALTRKVCGRSLYIEVSNLTQKMFGYAPLRATGFFPVRWMSIHNSLHSKTPEERISPRQLERVTAASHRGIQTHEVQTADDFSNFSRLMRHHYWLKVRRFLPDDSFFRGMMETGHCKLLITTYKGKTVGCSVIVYSEGDAYLWYSASRRKSYAALHPNAVTFWNTIRKAHQDGCQHIRFMDVGLPFRRNPYREFILSFGGKEVSTLRWFRINIKWINKLASWLWRE